MAVLPDGKIVSGSLDRTIRIWDCDSGDCIKILEGHTDVSFYYSSRFHQTECVIVGFLVVVWFSFLLYY